MPQKFWMGHEVALGPSYQQILVSPPPLAKVLTNASVTYHCASSTHNSATNPAVTCRKQVESIIFLELVLIRLGMDVSLLELFSPSFHLAVILICFGFRPKGQDTEIPDDYKSYSESIFSTLALAP